MTPAERRAAVRLESGQLPIVGAGSGPCALDPLLDWLKDLESRLAALEDQADG